MGTRAFSTGWSLCQSASPNEMHTKLVYAGRGVENERTCAVPCVSFTQKNTLEDLKVTGKPPGGNLLKSLKPPLQL